MAAEKGEKDAIFIYLLHLSKGNVIFIDVVESVQYINIIFGLGQVGVIIYNVLSLDTSSSSFCIAGDNISFAFIGCCPQPNTPIQVFK